jgi:thiol-disulfide isomerase/thioredoxin
MISLGMAFLLAPTLAAQDFGIALGSKAPGARVETLDGKEVDLADYLGKGPVLIEFWATWCGNCKALEPKMQAAIRKYGDRVHFLAVAVSVNQSPERIRAHKEAHGLLQDFVYDRKGYATDAYEVPATSYVVAVNARGVVVYTGLGSNQDIEAAVRKALQ